VSGLSNREPPAQPLRGSNLTVYVPRPGTWPAAMLAPRNALVGDADRCADGHVVCHYEGAIHEQADMDRFYDRLCHAGGRLVYNYPTVAKAAFRLADLIPVAGFDARRQVVTEVTDEPSLADWSGESAADIIGVRLPVGEVAWNDAVPIAQPPARVVGRQPTGASGILWYRTQSGQVIAFAAASRRAHVYDHTDPALAARLGVLSEIQQRMVFG